MQLSMSHVAEQEWIHRVVVEGMCVYMCIRGEDARPSKDRAIRALLTHYYLLFLLRAGMIIRCMF